MPNARIARGIYELIALILSSPTTIYCPLQRPKELRCVLNSAQVNSFYDTAVTCASVISHA